MRLINKFRCKSDKVVKLVEVGPRDGLQNEQFFVPTEIKQELIQRLYKAGLRTIETTSFVSPKWIPQMSDHSELMIGLLKNKDRMKDASFPVLVPNEAGLDAALSAGVTDVAVFTAASDAFNLKNVNCNINDSLKKLEALIQKAKKDPRINSVRGYVSCVIGCPFEGLVDPHKVNDVAKALLQFGCYQVSLGDTIGVGTPGHFRRLLSNLSISPHQLAVHCHDTFGQALSNILVALEEYSIRTVDCSVAGLGGCPFAPGATGNVATEDVLYMLNGLGYETEPRIDLTQLVDMGKWICGVMGRRIESRAANAIIASQNKLY